MKIRRGNDLKKVKSRGQDCILRANSGGGGQDGPRKGVSEPNTLGGGDVPLEILRLGSNFFGKPLVPEKWLPV